MPIRRPREYQIDNRFFKPTPFIETISGVRYVKENYNDNIVYHPIRIKNNKEYYVNSYGEIVYL